MYVDGIEESSSSHDVLDAETPFSFYPAPPLLPLFPPSSCVEILGLAIDLVEVFNVSE